MLNQSIDVGMEPVKHLVSFVSSLIAEWWRRLVYWVLWACGLSAIIICNVCPTVSGEPSPSHPILLKTRGLAVFCVHVCLLYVWFVCVLFVPSVLWYCWLGLLTSWPILCWRGRKTLLNPIQSCAQIMSKNLVQIRITLSTKLLSFVAQQWRPQNLQANLPQRITSEAFDVSCQLRL